MAVPGCPGPLFIISSCTMVSMEYNLIIVLVPCALQSSRISASTRIHELNSMMVIDMHMTRDPWWRFRVVIRMDSSCRYPVSMPQRRQYASTSMSGSFVANAMYFSYGSSSAHPSASLFLRLARLGTIDMVYGLSCLSEEVITASETRVRLPATKSARAP